MEEQVTNQAWQMFIIIGQGGLCLVLIIVLILVAALVSNIMDDNNSRDRRK